MNRSFVSSFRFVLIVVGILACFAAVFGRLFYLQVIDQDKLSRIVESNRKTFQVISARRGDIVDARGELLATTHEVYQIGVDPQSVKEEDYEKIPALAAILRVPETEIREKFDTRLREVSGPDGTEVRDVHWHKLADNISRDALLRIRDLDIRAVYGNPQYRRVYPSTSLAAHTVGFINKEGTPVAGVEQWLDFYLRGQDGWREAERDGRRRELVQFQTREVQPRSGLNVELTLDMVIQHFAEEQVLDLVKKYQPEGVTIIVSEPTTGYILALANYPSYNPNVFWKSPQEALRNRALTDVYEPGSTFKIVAASAALEERIVRPEDEVDCSLSVVEYKGREIRLPKDDHVLGKISVEQVVVKSSNRGAALLGMRLGDDRLYKYARAFGYGEKTDLGLGGESRGLLAEPARWDGLTISRLPMGHAVGATPLQVHMAMSTIANRGVLMQPLVVRRLFDEHGDTAVSFDPVARRRVVSSDTAHTVAAMLAKVCSPEGTAREAMIPGYEAAGKTGTTQKLVNGQYSSQHHVGSFSGFFPASSPALVITVVVDDPELKGIGYGGKVAAPAFRELAEKCAAYLGIPPSEGKPMLALSER
jgi:cell division protein FtsI (penicillin-binding protein 3)/stage V sporulation protein D (sporulation-specific penicillin-binding protein)